MWQFLNVGRGNWKQKSPDFLFCISLTKVSRQKALYLCWIRLYIKLVVVLIADSVWVTRKLSSFNLWTAVLCFEVCVIFMFCAKLGFIDAFTFFISVSVNSVSGLPGLSLCKYGRETEGKETLNVLPEIYWRQIGNSQFLILYIFFTHLFCMHHNTIEQHGKWPIP